MFCTKCGKQLPEGSAFCGQCGTPVAKAPEKPITPPPVVETPVKEVRPVEVQAPVAAPVVETPVAAPVVETPVAAPVVETPVAAPVVETPVAAPVVETPVAAPVVETPAAAAPAFAQFEAPKPAKPRKKSKKKLIGWLSAAAAVLVAGAVAVGMFWKPIQGVWMENFGSDADYLSYVEQNSTQKLTDTLSGAYGSLTEALSSGTATQLSGAYDMNMKLTVGEKTITMLETLVEERFSEKMELDWLSSIDLDMNMNTQESLNQIAMALKLDETEIAKVEMILNMAKGEAFLAIPTLSDKYLKTEMEMSAAIPNELMDLLSDEDLLKILPSEAEMDALLDKYIGIVFDNLQEVEKTTETVKVAGIQQKLTALETKINEKDVTKVMTALMKAAKDDKQIKKIIENAADFLEDNDMIEDADDAYKAFVDGLEDALESVEDVEFDAEIDIVLTDYVNSDHEVVGRRIEVNDEEVLYYIEIHQGTKMAFELEMQGVEINGEGTDKNGVVNAEYSVIAADREVCVITLEDFKSNKEIVNGKIRIAPSSDLLKSLVDNMDSAGASAIGLLDPQLELVFAGDKNSTKIEINLLSGKDMLVGISISAKEAKGGKITEPDKKNVYDQDEAQEWLQEMDVQKLLETLEDITDLPLSDLMNGGISQGTQKPAIGGNTSSNVKPATRPTTAPTTRPTTAPTTRPVATMPVPSEPSWEATEPTMPVATESTVEATEPVFAMVIKDVDIDLRGRAQNAPCKVYVERDGDEVYFGTVPAGTEFVTLRTQVGSGMVNYLVTINDYDGWTQRVDFSVESSYPNISGGSTTVTPGGTVVYPNGSVVAVPTLPVEW